MPDPASGTYAVVWPRSEKAVEVKPLAKRLAGLDGKKVAFLWDYLFRGDEIWAMLQEELPRRHPGMSFVGYGEFGSTHGDEEHRVLTELPAKLKALGIDAVVSGMGC